MDKVYVRILSVSLLLSLCGAGVARPDVCRAILMSESEPSHVRLFSANPGQRGGGAALCGVEAQNGRISGFKRFFASLSSRLAQICCGGGREVVNSVDSSTPRGTKTSIFSCHFHGLLPEGLFLCPQKGSVEALPTAICARLGLLLGQSVKTRAGPHCFTESTSPSV